MNDMYLKRSNTTCSSVETQEQQVSYMSFPHKYWYEPVQMEFFHEREKMVEPNQPVVTLRRKMKKRKRKKFSLAGMETVVVEM